MGKIGREKAGKIKDDKGKRRDAEEVDRIHQEEAATALPASKCSLMAAGEVGKSVRHHVG